MVNISLDGRFLVVIVTPNPCPRHVCLMSLTKENHVNGHCWRTRMLLIGKKFANKGFYLNALQVVCTDRRSNRHEFCHVRHVGKSVLLMRSWLWSYLKACIAQLADKKYSLALGMRKKNVTCQINGTFQMSLPLTRCTAKVNRTQIGQTAKRTSIFRRK